MAFTKIAAAGIGSTGTVTLENLVVTGGITASLTGTATSTTNIPNLTGAITSNNTTTSLGSFSSANLATALSDKTGSGSAVFATSPTLTTVTVSSGGINVTGVSTLGNTVIGGGTTQLVVTGNARITGILTIGTSSITLDGSNNQLNVGTGVTLHHTNGVQVGGNTLHSTGLTLNSLTATGVSTFTNGPVLIGSATSTGTGLQRLQVTGGAYVSGSVGIGTTNPIAKLDVRSELKSSGATPLILSSTDATDQFQLAVSRSVAGSGSYYSINSIEQNVAFRNLLLNQSGGNVGIGTINPQEPLHVNAPINALAVIRLSGSAADQTPFNIRQGIVGTNNGGFSIYDVNNSATRFAIDPSGNIGIGVANPYSKSHIVVSSNSTALLLNNTTGGADSYVDLDFATYSVYQSGYANAPATIRIIDDGSFSGHITFRTKTSGAIGNVSTEKMRLDSSGNLGVGTANPARKLDVRGEATFGAGITISDLSWGKDTNQLVYTFSGTASGTNPADGCIAIVNPNANPSGSRVGSLVYGNKVSGTIVTGNPGLKAVIECYTNTNVANAADTGAYLNFHTKPDNANNRLQMTLNSNGVLTKPYQPAFLAYRNSTLSVTGGIWQLISSGMLTESYDVGSVYSTSTNGRFVAPVAGKYMFYAGGYSVANTSGERYAFGVKINNVGGPDFITGGNYCITDTPLVPYQIVLNLAANDYVELYYFSAISTTIGGTVHVLYWGGYLLG